MSSTDSNSFGHPLAKHLHGTPYSGFESVIVVPFTVDYLLHLLCHPPKLILARLTICVICCMMDYRLPPRHIVLRDNVRARLGF